MNIIKCQNCGKDYGYYIWGDVYPGGKDREEAICPYCGTVGYSRMTSQNITSVKLDEVEEPIDFQKTKVKIKK